MDDNSFFKFVWRFNALAIAGGVVIGGLLAAYAALQVFRYETRERQVTDVVNVGGDERAKEAFVMGSVERLPGTDFVRVRLYRIQSTDLGSYSKSGGGNEVNFLFLNVVTNAGKWMLPNANQLFLSDTILYNKLAAPADQSRAAVGVLFTAVEKDTDGDKRLTSRDLVALTFSATDGTGYRKVADGIEQIVAVQQVADDRLLAIYQKDKVAVSDLYALPGMTLLSQQSIPKVELK